jgi:hypothetical protein
VVNSSTDLLGSSFSIINNVSICFSVTNQGPQYHYTCIVKFKALAIFHELLTVNYITNVSMFFSVTIMALDIIRHPA